VLSACLIGVFAVNPGLQFKVNEGGLNWGTNVAFDLLTPMVLGQELPALRGKIGVVVGDVHYDINRARVANFDRGNFRLSVGHGDIKASANGFHVRLKGYWSYRYQLVFITVADSGQFDADVRVNFNVGVGIRADSNGRASIRSTSCHFDVNHLKLTFSGGASWLYNLFIDVAAGMFKGQIGGMICDGMNDVMDRFANPALAKMALEFTVPELGTFDFHMTGSPQMVPNYVQSYHKGVFYPIGSRTYPPFSPAPLPTSIASNRMVNVWVSAFMANSFLYAMQDKLNADITPEMLGSANGHYLNVYCDAPSICFGSILPESVKQQFSSESVGIVKVRATERPHVEISSSEVSIVAEAHVEMFVRDGAEETFLFSANVDANGGVFVWMANEKVHFEVKSLHASLEMVENETPGIRESTLNILLRAGLGTVTPFLNDMGAAGLPLPKLSGINYRNPTISLHNEAVVFQVDGSH